MGCDEPRLSDEVLDAVRRHVDSPEIAAYSLCVGVTFHPEWPDDPAAQVEIIDDILTQIPRDLVDKSGREAALEAVRNEMDL